jgi:hypothetical protein
MISRVTMRKVGLSEYLEEGKRADSNLFRDDKDNVLPLYGSLTTFKKAELYCNQYKTWNSNYEHITISFSDEDSNVLNALSNEVYNNTLKDIVLDMIKHRTSGYDLENEVIAYAELHDPKVKYEESQRTGELQKRYKHIHIAISYLNPLSDTKLQTTFYNNSYISDTIDKYIAKKHGLSFAIAKEPNDAQVDRETIMSINRQELKNATKDFLTGDELFSFFDANSIEYGFTNKNSKTKQSNVYVYNEKGGKIHLRGRDFSNIEIMMNPNYSDDIKSGYIKELKNKSLQELGDILEKYYKDNRIPLIDKRRSKETKDILNDIYNQNSNTVINDKINQFSSFQEKIFYKHYKQLLSTDLKGYYIDTHNVENVIFSHKSKEIEVHDLGDKIKTNSNHKNLEEKVGLMLDIAMAKNWEMDLFEVRGSDIFKKEVFKQMVERIEKEKEKIKNKKPYSIKDIERAKTPTQYLAKEQQDKKEEKNTALQELKKMLNAQSVLVYAGKEYRLDMSQYEVTADNKINNLTNRAKPKNVIDFLQKELNLTSKEAIEKCKALYKVQPLEIEKVELIVPPEVEKKVKEEKKAKNLREEKKEFRIQKIRRTTELLKKLEVKKKEKQEEKNISQVVRRGIGH